MRFTFPLLTLLVCHCLPIPAHALGLETSPTKLQSRATISGTTSFVDGKPFLESLLKTASGFSDYTYDSVFTLQKTKGEQGAGSFFYKKLDLIRVQVKTSGPRNGTIIVRQPDGKIRLAGGNMIKFLKITVSPDSRLLMLPNGYNLVKSDLVGLLSGVMTTVLAGSKARVTANPVLVERLNRQAAIFEIVKEGDSQELTDRIFIDPATNVPLAWDVYRGGNWFSTVTFDNFRSNIGLKDDLFKL